MGRRCGLTSATPLPSLMWRRLASWTGLQDGPRILVAEEPHLPVVQRVSRRARHPWCARVDDVGHREFVPVRQGMRLADQDPARLDGHRGHLRTRHRIRSGLSGKVEDHRRVEVAAGQTGQGGRRQVDARGDVQVGQRLHEVATQQSVVAGVRREPDREPAGCLDGTSPVAVDGAVLHVPADRLPAGDLILQSRHELRPGGREQHAARAALEQPGAEFGFDALHPLGQRRL